jgi:hypothetical protein
VGAGSSSPTRTRCTHTLTQFPPSLALGAAQKLLDDTGDQIDQSNTGLVRETARVEHVTKEAGTCWLYMAICLLLLVLIGLILGRWA